jgi:hypothetical protein
MKSAKKLNLKEWLAGDIDVRIPKLWVAMAGVAVLVLIMLALD